MVEGSPTLGEELESFQSLRSFLVTAPLPFWRDLGERACARAESRVWWAGQERSWRSQLSSSLKALPNVPSAGTKPFLQQSELKLMQPFKFCLFRTQGEVWRGVGLEEAGKVEFQISQEPVLFLRSDLGQAAQTSPLWAVIWQKAVRFLSAFWFTF